MSKIKLCGMFREEDIEYANQAKPDFVGFVFAPSKRRIDYEKAKYFKSLLSKDILSVGVFVNHNLDMIIKLVKDGVIDLVQLHGNEDEEYIEELKKHVEVPIIKAIRVKDVQDIVEGDKLQVDYLLLDTFEQGSMGGTGKIFDWSMIPKISKPYFLAGGINLSNIEEANKYGAFCLDTSSGVETDGIKDKNKMIEIVRKIRWKKEDLENMVDNIYQRL